MKKIFAIVLTVAMILSLGVVFASAAVPNLTGTPGVWSGGSAENHETLENYEIAWVPDAATKIDLTDGNLDDWKDYSFVTVTPNNMVSWAGLDAVPEGWGMQVYLLADADYLYVGFYITDPEVYAIDPANPGAYTAGDCFQINIDFGRKLGWLVQNDPEMAEMMTNTKNVFYSFGYNGDKGPVAITVQETDYTPDTGNLLDADDGVKGTTGKTDAGWCAEFTIPWERMALDYQYKSWQENADEDFKAVYVGGKDQKALELGVGFYYLCQGDTVDADGNPSHAMTWAAGLHSGFCGTDENGNELDPASNPPIVRWDVYDNALTAYIPPQEGLKFTTNLISVLEDEQTEPPTESETEAPTDEPTDAPTDAPTGGESAAGTTATTEKEEEGGCASVIGASAIAVLVAAGAAVVLKKKD